MSGIVSAGNHVWANGRIGMQVLRGVLPILASCMFGLPLAAQEISPSDSATLETIERFFVASRVEQVFASSRELMFGSVPAPEPIAGRWRELMAKYLPYDSVKVDLFRISVNVKIVVA